jgi:hypothetical protein
MAIGFPVKANYVTGEVLTATNMNDLSGSVNLLQSAQYAAGKNVIINGDFNVWQRGTSFTNNAHNTFNADRWKQFYDGSGATRIISQQTFTPGTAPSSPYEGTYFLRFNQTVAGTAATYNVLTQPVENVRTFAGNTVTYSYWARAGAPLTMTIEAEQNFGSGGSATVATTATQSITTSWARYSNTFTMPSVSGKTIGAGSFINMSFKLPLNSTFTFDVWGVQLEASSTASSFQTATGTIQGELAACQRYYYRQTVGTTYGYLAFGMATSTTNGKIQIPLPGPLRIIPTSIDSPTAATLRFTDGVTGTACNASPTLDADTSSNSITFNVGVASGLTQYRPIFFGANNSAVAYIGFSAEL